MSGGAVGGCVKNANVERAGVADRPGRCQIFVHVLPAKALAVECRVAARNRNPLRPLVIEEANMIWPRQTGRHPVGRVVVPQGDIRHDAGIAEPLHLGDEVQSGVAVSPFTVEQVAGDHHEGGLTLDREIHQLAERLTCCQADFFQRRAGIVLQ
jgi:hypothetical protein